MGRRRNQAVGPTTQSVVGAEALGNWVTMIGGVIGSGGTSSPAGTGLPAAQTMTGTADGTALASIALQTKYSGVPRFDLNVQFGDNTTAETIILALAVKIFALPVTTRLFAAKGTGTISSANVLTSRDMAQDFSSQTAWGAVLTNDAAGNEANTYTFDGAGLVPPATGNMFTINLTQVGTLTGQLHAGQDFTGYSGLLVDPRTINSGNTPSRLPLDSVVVATLYIVPSGSGDVVSFQRLSMTLQEQPLG